MGPAPVDPAPGPAARRAARPDPGPPAVADPQAAGLLVPPALPVRARGAQAHRPAARLHRVAGRQRPAPGGLPAAAADAAPAVVGARHRRDAHDAKERVDVPEEAVDTEAARAAETEAAR